MGGAFDAAGGDEKLYKVLIRKTEGNRLLGRPRRRWENNVKIYLLEMGWECNVNQQQPY